MKQLIYFIKFFSPPHSLCHTSNFVSQQEARPFDQKIYFVFFQFQFWLQDISMSAFNIFSTRALSSWFAKKTSLVFFSFNEYLNVCIQHLFKKSPSLLVLMICLENLPWFSSFQCRHQDISMCAFNIFSTRVTVCLSSWRHLSVMCRWPQNRPLYQSYTKQ